MSGDLAGAACAGTDLSTWFPDARQSIPRAERERRSSNTRAAIRVCAGCPVRDACLDLAMTSGVEGGPVAHGIWAGINFSSPTARRDAIRAHRARQGVS